MCLSKVLPSKKKKETVMVAYKSFYLEGNSIAFSHRSLNGSRRVRRGKWLIASQTEMSTDEFFKHRTKFLRRYASGFHCFLTPRGASRWSGNFKTPVLVKEVQYFGKQSGYSALTAKYIYVPNKNEKIVGRKIVKIKETK